MKKIYILIAVLFCSLQGFSQRVKTDANVQGHVVDTKTKEHLPFMTISIKGTTNAVATDASGHYFMKNLPLGKVTLMVSGVGYKSVEKEVVMEKDKTIEVNFETEQTMLDLEGVVISANRNETKRKEAPAIINVLTPKVLEKTSSVCLGQGLNFQPGLRVETNCQNCGTQQLRMNGLAGTYSQILIDSRPIFSALAGVYGLEQIPVNMIERVEVLRGGGSAIFGSNAIAGTVNIITKEPNSNSGEVSHTTSLMGGETTDFNTSFNTSIVSSDYKAGLVLFGAARQRDAYDHDGDGYSEISKINMKNVGFRAYYRTSDYSKLSIEYHTIHEFRRGGDSLDLPAHQANIAEQIEHDINSGGLKYDFFSKDNVHRFSLFTSAQKINRKSYYGAEKDPNAYGNSIGKTFDGGGQYSYNMNKLLFMPAELTTGLEYNYDELEDHMEGYGKHVNQDVHIFSGFLQNEWKNKELSLLLGFRLDKHNLMDKVVFSPRVNLRYAPLEFMTLRGSFSSGFRAPQVFDEDLHIEQLDGKVRYIIQDPNLKPEKSYSYSASVDLYKTFDHISTNLLIEGFYTDLRDVFVNNPKGEDAHGNYILERTNGSGAEVKGVNLEAKLAHGKNLQVQMGLTLRKSEYKERPEKWDDDIAPRLRFLRTPNQYGYLTVDYSPIKKFDISLSGTYTGSMIVPHKGGKDSYIAKSEEKETDPFFDLGFKLGYEINVFDQIRLKFDAGIKNIFNSYQNDFDKGVKRDATYIYGPALPRTYFAGIKLSI